MKKTLHWIFILALSSGVCTQGLAATSAPVREPLRLKNDFQKPEQVVRYYCGRNASGFVWAGLLEQEVKAFTFWKEWPHWDTFLIAEKYDISPSKMKGKNEASVEVNYTLLALADGNGSILPPPVRKKRIIFGLKRSNSPHGPVWKIATPSPHQLPPIILESILEN